MRPPDPPTCPSCGKPKVARKLSQASCTCEGFAILEPPADPLNCGIFRLHHVLQGLAQRPEMWGSPEAVELQYLLGIEVLATLKAVTFEGDGANRLWTRILHENGYRSNLPLFDQVEGYEEHQRLLPLLYERIFNG